MLDAYEAEGATDVRALAGALVRPMAAKLTDPDGGPAVPADHGRPHEPSPARRSTPVPPTTPTSSIDRWRRLVGACSTTTPPACTAGSPPSGSRWSSWAAAPGRAPAATSACSRATSSTSSPGCCRLRSPTRRGAWPPPAPVGASGTRRPAMSGDAGSAPTSSTSTPSPPGWTTQGLPARADHRRPRPCPAARRTCCMRFTRGGRDYVLRRGPRHLRRGQQRRHAARGPGAAGAGRAGRAPPRVRRRARRARQRRGRRRGLLPDGAGRGVQPDAGPARRSHAGDPAVRHEMGLAGGRGRRRARRRRPRGRRPGRLRQARRLPRASGRRAGWASSTRTATSTATPAPTSPASTGWPRGSTTTGRASWRAGHHARRLPPVERDDRARRARGRRHRRLGDVHDRRPAARPREPARHLAGRPRSDGRLAAARPRRRLRRHRRRHRRPPLPRRAGRPLRRAHRPRHRRGRPGTRPWPASSSASSSRAPTPGPAPARRRRRSATCSTPPPSGCSPAPTSSIAKEG